MAENRKIILGGREFTLRPLDLDQLQELGEDLQLMNPLLKDGVAAIRKCMLATMVEPISNEEFGKLPVTLDELHLASTELAEASGLRPLIKRLAAARAASQPS